MKSLVINRDIKCGKNVWIHPWAKLDICEIGDNTRVGSEAEIGKDSVLGKNVRVMSRARICEHVVVEDEATIGSDVSFVHQLSAEELPDTGSNGKGGVYASVDATIRVPSNGNGNGRGHGNGHVFATIVKKGAAIGNGVKIMCGVTIGEGAMIAEGSMVFEDVPPFAIVAGIPARVVRRRKAIQYGV
jgi:UDP-2-acetamido-3-amino-2,3-dideoxy-glucuronate N-acetyltransferase